MGFKLYPARGIVIDELLEVAFCTFTGSEQTLQRKLSAFVAETGIEELMITSHIYGIAAKLKSFLIVSKVMNNA